MPDHTVQSFEPDDIDRAIITAMKNDGRISNQQLSRELNITPSAISQRIKRLEKHDVIRLVLVTDFALMGCELLVAIGIQTNKRSAGDVAIALARLPQVFSVSTMIGRYPVEALVALSDVTALRHFIEHELASIEGIADVEYNFAANMLKYEFDVVPFREKLQPLPVSATVADDLDRLIIDAFSKSPRASNATIGNALGVTEGTVRARLKRLRERGLIRFSVLTNALRTGAAGYVFIRIRAKVCNARAIADQLAAMSEARCVILTAGTHNIMALGHFNARRSDTSPIDRIMRIPGLLAMETSTVIESKKYDIRVAKIIMP